MSSEVLFTLEYSLNTFAHFSIPICSGTLEVEKVKAKLEEYDLKIDEVFMKLSDNTLVPFTEQYIDGIQAGEKIELVAETVSKDSRWSPDDSKKSVPRHTGPIRKHFGGSRGRGGLGTRGGFRGN